MAQGLPRTAEWFSALRGPSDGGSSADMSGPVIDRQVCRFWPPRSTRWRVRIGLLHGHTRPLACACRFAARTAADGRRGRRFRKGSSGSMGTRSSTRRDGTRYRLPIGNPVYQQRPELLDLQRTSREVTTERDLFQCAGTFYELPARNAGGFSRIRPIATHPYFVQDYCSWRGLLAMTGTVPRR